MTFAQFIVIPIFIAFQAFTMMLIARYVPGNPLAIGGAGLMTWVAFQAWAVYFFAGFAPWNDKENGPCPRMGGKTMLGYLGGIICSIAIFELNGVFASLNSADGGHLWGLYLAVFLVVIAVIACEKAPFFNFVPAWFIGAGVFFALMTFAGGSRPEAMSDWGWYGTLALVEMVACFVGQVYGWITVTFRGAYESKFTSEDTTPITDAEVA